MSGRKPDFRMKVKARDREDPRTGVAGAGWVNADGSISIKLDVGFRLDWKDDLLITMFPEGDNARIAALGMAEGLGVKSR